MRTVVLFPTVEEAKGFLLSEPHVPVFVSGTGPAQTSAAVVRAVKARKPHLVVLAGTAAACDRSLALGEAVEVTSQFEAGLAAAERQIYRVDPVTDLPEAAGCSAQTVFPFIGEKLHTGAEAGTEAAEGGLQAAVNKRYGGTAAADTGASEGVLLAVGPPNEAAGAEKCDPPAGSGLHNGGTTASADTYPLYACEDRPQVVSREGAALMAVCEALEVRCCEIRVPSHYAGETPAPEACAQAAERLTEILKQIFENHEQE